MKIKKESLHLLILEDNPTDAELAIRELEREGFVVIEDKTGNSP
jgi:CheY-like chemotaxis protein